MESTLDVRCSIANDSQLETGYGNARDKHFCPLSCQALVLVEGLTQVGFVTSNKVSRMGEGIPRVQAINITFDTPFRSGNTLELLNLLKSVLKCDPQLTS